MSEVNEVRPVEEYNCYREQSAMPCAVWYLNTREEWELFYGLDNMWDALQDARKTIGIDVWAIVRGTTVMAYNREAQPFIEGLSLMLKYFRRNNHMPRTWA